MIKTLLNAAAVSVLVLAVPAFAGQATVKGFQQPVEFVRVLPFGSAQGSNARAVARPSRRPEAGARP